MDFTNLYKEKLTDPRTKAEEIQDNWVCGMDIAAGIPTILANVIAEVSKEDKFKNVSMHSILDITKVDFYNEGFENIRPISWFSGGGLRNAVNDGGETLCRVITETGHV